MMIEPAAPTPLEKNKNMIANATDQPKFPHTRLHTLLAHWRRELSGRLVLDRCRRRHGRGICSGRDPVMVTQGVDANAGDKCNSNDANGYAQRVVDTLALERTTRKKGTRIDSHLCSFSRVMTDNFLK
jgi:hypothetical protein